MIIVVEGPDNAGKTTIALSLAKQLKAVYLKSENIPPEAAFLPQYGRMLWAAKSYGNGIVISDRHHAISDPIYGPIVRGWTKLRREDIDEAMSMIDAYIYCRPIDGKIIGTMPERQQMSGVIQNIREIIDTYDKFFSQPEIDNKTWRYDYIRNSEIELAEEIKRYA